MKDVIAVQELEDVKKLPCNHISLLICNCIASFSLSRGVCVLRPRREAVAGGEAVPQLDAQGGTPEVADGKLNTATVTQSHLVKQNNSWNSVSVDDGKGEYAYM